MSDAQHRMRLTHLTFIGRGVKPASVEFSPKLTVIAGPTDTGKSFILESIDYVLGRNDLSDIPEARPYSHVLLGVKFGSGELTLMRPLGDGKIEAYGRDIRDFPTDIPDVLLAPKHNAKSEKNVSKYLLAAIEAPHYQVRTNASNKTRGLSFRDIARLCLVSEGKIQDKTSPILSGKYEPATVEKSIYKLFLEGRDDAELIEAQSPKEKAISRSNGALLDRVVAKLSEDLSAFPADADEQLERIEVSINKFSQLVTEAVAERDATLAEREAARKELGRLESRLAEIRELVARFDILGEQYKSDIGRLEMVAEGGTLLGLFEPDICMLCGAGKEHQQAHVDGVVGSEILHEAAVVEMAKTAGLLMDLEATIASMRAEEKDLLQDVHQARLEQQRFNQIVHDQDQVLLPSRNELSQLSAARVRIQQGMVIREQILRVEGLRRSIDLEAPETVESMVSKAGTSDAEFSARISRLLTTWGVPDTTSARINEDYELIVSGRPRKSRGKGTRALQHAAFTLALSSYCLAEGRAFPGFVVLDSPLVTYRQPDPGEDEDIPVSVADSFYRYLAKDYAGQAIVLENQDPPEDIAAISSIIKFTSRENQGRYGFLPTVKAENILPISD